jgi:hypothetical protein
LALKMNPRAGDTKTTPAERIGPSFKQLAAASSELNSAGDELCEVIATVEAPLATIKPPVAAWHQIAGTENQNGTYWHRDIGYAKVGKTWGIALRTVDGHQALDEDNTEMWLFKDAPRWMQIESVGKIPDLFETLIKRTEETAAKLRAKTTEARQLADALSRTISELNGQQKQ